MRAEERESIPCVAQVLEKRSYILLHRLQQHPIAPLEELGKSLQIAEICLAGKRTQPLFYAQIRPDNPLRRSKIAFAFHSPDYPRLPAGPTAAPGAYSNHVHQGINFITSPMNPFSHVDSAVSSSNLNVQNASVLDENRIDLDEF